MNLDVKSGSASMPSSSYCDDFSNNGALKKFPPEEKEMEGVFLKKQKTKTESCFAGTASDELEASLRQ